MSDISEEEVPEGFDPPVDAMEIRAGCSVWIPDESLVWKIANVTAVQGEGVDAMYEVDAVSSSGKTPKAYTHAQIVPVDPSHLVDMDNMCLMNNMHEAPLLDLLHRRFAAKKIYTYTSDILISLNPFELIPGLYESPSRYYHIDDSTSGYFGVEDEDINSTLAPHVYQIANNALKALCKGRQGGDFLDQSVIISGESGAGKTENSKYVLGYLIEANNILSTSASSAEETSIAEYLKDVLVQSSVVLEAFGNAKTLRNDNSSRFGKYIKLLYESDISHADGRPYPRLVSAMTETFLLEKSRLTSVGKGERCYHIFYQLVSALEDVSLREEFGLHHGVEAFRMLAQGECLGNSHDVAEYQSTVNALKKLQVSPEELKQVIQVLASILHLGNLQFEVIDEESGRVILSCPTIEMETLSNMLGLHSATLRMALTTQSMQVRGRASIRTKVLSIDDVANNSNALLKWLYSKLFDWLVRKINFCHHSVHSSHGFSGHFIGILDIFGFEILKVNSFEQLCINYTNERLQQQFNQHVFISEQEMYRSEGLEWKNISFQDNQPVIDLISSTKKPLGLLQLLEEQGMLNRKPDDSLVLSAFNQQHDIKGKPANEVLYSKSKFGNSGFNIKHFAGEVSYLIDGFLVKNNDSLQEDLMNTMRLTTNKFYQHILGFARVDPISQEILQDPGYLPVTSSSSINSGDAPTVTAATAPTSASGIGGKKMASSSSVSLQFRVQLDSLMSTLFSTSPHYIKCIKSNNLKEGFIFEPKIIIQQLRYSGVLEVVRIRREGFPVRMAFKDFLLKYRILLRGTIRHFKPEDIHCLPDDVTKTHCENIISIADVAHFVQVGHSLIFLRDKAVYAMHMAIERFYSLRAVIIQSNFRAHLQSRRFLMFRKCSTKLKSFFLMLPHRMRYKRMIRAANIIKFYLMTRLRRKKFLCDFYRKISAITIQKHVRRYIKWQRYLQMRQAVILLQSHIRKHIRQTHFVCILKSIVRLQSWARCIVARQQYTTTLMCSIFVQTVVRGYLAKKKYQRQRSAVIAIQSFTRMKLTSKLYQRRRVDSIAIQSLVRSFICRRRFVKTINAIRLQSVVRRFVARTKYIRHIKAVKIQACIRRFICRQRFEKILIATFAIQTTIRKFLHRRKFLLIKASAIRIQAIVRRYLSIKHFMQHYVAIIRLQSFARMIIAMRNYGLQLVATTVLQTWFRMIPYRHDFLLQKYAAIKLQTSIRRFLAMEQYGRVQYATVKIQAVVRTYLCMSRLRMSYAAVIALQSFIRKSLAQRKYMITYGATVAIQTAVRGFFTKSRYLFVRFMIIFLQKMVRGMLARRQHSLSMAAAVKLQSFGRMLNARYKYNEALINIITIQAFVRCHLQAQKFQHFRACVVMTQTYARRWLAMQHFQQDYSRVIKLQAFGRRVIDRSRYQETLFYIIFAQSILRRLIYRMRYLHTRKMIVRLQAWFRSQPPRRQFNAYRRAVTMITKHFRRWVEHAKYTILRYAAWRSQTAIRAFLHNSALKKRMHLIHNTPQNMLSTVTLAKTTMQTIANSLLQLHPEDRKIRYFEFDYRSLLHSMILYADEPVIADVITKFMPQFRFSSAEIVETDLFGRSSAHYLGMQPSMLQAYFIARILNTFVDPTLMKSDVMEGLDEDDDDNTAVGANTTGDHIHGDNRVNKIKQAVTESVQKSTLRQGWLKKKRGGMMWQKRWMVLTEDYMIYYKNNTTLNNPKFAIPLEGCTVQRVPGSREPCFEIFAPNMGVKKSLFGSSTKKSVVFLAETEKEMQEWLTPLRAVAGVDTLRSSAVNYIRMELRVLWLAQPDKLGESALHNVVRGISGLRARLLTLMEKTEFHLNYYHHKLEESVKLIAWLVENGCPVNMQNSDGDTALHVALMEGSDPLIVRTLITRGANPRSLRNNDGMTCFDVLNQDTNIRKTFAEEFAYAMNLPPRANAMGFDGKMKGYSYLSIYFAQQDFEKSLASVSEQPMLLVSACNSQNELVESKQEVRGAAIVRSMDTVGPDPKKIYWGQTWHMRTPIENLEPGSLITVEYKARSDGPVISLGQFPIERETIDSKEVLITLLPVGDASGRQANPILLQNEKSTLSMEIVLTRKPRMIPFDILYLSS